MSYYIARDRTFPDGVRYASLPLPAADGWGPDVIITPAKDPAMSASTTTYTLSLARSENGNWSLEPSEALREHYLHPFPPMALPVDQFPTTEDAQRYAAALLTTAGVLTPPSLAWHVYGHTAHDGSPAYRAAWRVTVESLSPAL